VVVELECGVTVYPAVEAGGRWRAVWHEGGRRRQCESVCEDGLAGRLEPVIERLTADAPNLERPGADRDLMAQDQDLGVLGPVGPGEQGQPAEHAQHDQVCESQGHEH
jgi:hypothetical protein